MGLAIRHTYHANVIAVWDHWVVQIPEADGAHCLVLDREDAERAARDAIAIVLGIEAETFEVVVAE